MNKWEIGISLKFVFTPFSSFCVGWNAQTFPTFLSNGGVQSFSPRVIHCDQQTWWRWRWVTSEIRSKKRYCGILRAVSNVLFEEKPVVLLWEPESSTMDGPEWRRTEASSQRPHEGCGPSSPGQPSADGSLMRALSQNHPNLLLLDSWHSDGMGLMFAVLSCYNLG